MLFDLRLAYIFSSLGSSSFPFALQTFTKNTLQPYQSLEPQPCKPIRIPSFSIPFTEGVHTRNNQSALALLYDIPFLEGLYGQAKAMGDPAMLETIREAIDALQVFKNHDVRPPDILPFDACWQKSSLTSERCMCRPIPLWR